MTIRRSLEVGEVHFWHVVLHDWINELPVLLSTLSSSERTRGDRYIVEDARTVFQLCRGLLRKFLCEYGVAQAVELELSLNAFGKPELSGAHGSNRIEFNVSHSGRHAAFAFARTSKVGVDIEQVRPLPFDEIAKTSFATEEWNELQSIAPELRPMAFYQGWTRKEAFLKATGMGFHRPMNSFAVSLATPARLMRTDFPSDWEQSWTMMDQSQPGQFAAAVVFQGPMKVISDRLSPPGIIE